MEIAKLRTILIVFGLALMTIARLVPNVFLALVAINLYFYGCYLWVRLKNRHWIFMFWGIFGLIGLIALLLLTDKSKSVYKPGFDLELEYFRCPKCGFENWEGYKICQKCGTLLRKPIIDS